MCTQVLLCFEEQRVRLAVGRPLTRAPRGLQVRVLAPCSLPARQPAAGLLPFPHVLPLQTPTNSDAAAEQHSSSGGGSYRQQAHSSPAVRPAPLSVHWAEALEQHCVRPHAPQHAQHPAPDKPCLKPQQSSFPFLQEAGQLDGLMRRPWAGHAGSHHQYHHPAAKKRSRLAAFGQ